MCVQMAELDFIQVCRNVRALRRRDFCIGRCVCISFNIEIRIFKFRCLVFYFRHVHDLRTLDDAEFTELEKTSCRRVHIICRIMGIAKSFLKKLRIQFR